MTASAQPLGSCLGGIVGRPFRPHPIRGVEHAVLEEGIKGPNAPSDLNDGKCPKDRKRHVGPCKHHALYERVYLPPLGHHRRSGVVHGSYQIALARRLENPRGNGTSAATAGKIAAGILRRTALLKRAQELYAVDKSNRATARALTLEGWGKELKLKDGVVNEAYVRRLFQWAKASHGRDQP